ncbi:class I SAM-dependent methyltransferase [Mycobacterium sp. NPDC050551]|uniref:class I SAM-dependent methyltransferase n=1 Tax=Mycobacterium sp. NPDC050551 TaxID=3155407 RepID=UPI00341D9508
MTKDRSIDYLPAAGRDAFLPGYDLLTRVLGMRPAYRALIEQAGLANGQQVLEIGCGTGNVTVSAKRSHPGAQFTGSDPDPRALERARRKIKSLTGIRFERAYAQRLPYPDGSFDRVLSSMMLHHLDEGTKVQAAAEAFRVLRPGGSLHVVDIDGHTHGHAHGHGETIADLLSAAGFDVDEVGTHRLRLFGQVTRYRATRPQV